ncbi:MAG: 4'-phosphopantetheinyl transferase superfamily protein [Flammeovirgaceae bacterium]|nr:4'-phosphopantetheinyl transferase superfamily protein [Flammeovirgaceae bacterium]
MPRIKSDWSATESGWALWKITESADELAVLASPALCPVDIISANKKLEWLAGRALMKSMVEHLGFEFVGIRKDEYGKPALVNLPHQISISHSYPYVAIQIDRNYEVGIDLEQPKKKLLNIAHRVLDPIELEDAGTDEVKHCVYWCAKEALYKIYGKRGLSFSENLKIAPFNLQESGSLNAEVKNQTTILKAALKYQVSHDFVLVITDTKN